MNARKLIVSRGSKTKLAKALQGMGPGLATPGEAKPITDMKGLGGTGLKLPTMPKNTAPLGKVPGHKGAGSMAAQSKKPKPTKIEVTTPKDSSIA